MVSEVLLLLSTLTGILSSRSQLFPLYEWRTQNERIILFRPPEESMASMGEDTRYAKHLRNIPSHMLNSLMKGIIQLN